MQFRDIIERVQTYSGFSDSESRDAIEMMVESIAIRLNETERKAFAAQLPPELQDIALAVYPTEANIRQDLLEQFMQYEHLEANRAKQHIMAAWQALKDAVSEVEITHLQAQLPRQLVALLP